VWKYVEGWDWNGRGMRGKWEKDGRRMGRGRRRMEEEEDGGWRRMAARDSQSVSADF
jgi:hypothetical protein